MIRDFCSSLIASFVVVLGTACTDVEPGADEPSADVQSTADPGPAIDPTQLVDYVQTPGGDATRRAVRVPELQARRDRYGAAD